MSNFSQRDYFIGEGMRSLIFSRFLRKHYFANAVFCSRLIFKNEHPRRILTLKKRLYVFVILLSIVMLSACSGGNGNVNNNDDPEPGNNSGEENNNGVDEEISLREVTLKVAFPDLGEHYFDLRFGATDEALDKIDLEYIPYGNSVDGLEELFAADEAPDIIIGDYAPIEELGIGNPLDDLIARHNFDLDRIDPSLLSFMRSLDDEGRVVGFPDGTSFWGLYYNKEVFDRLGKDYPDPSTPMTWHELMDLAREMTVEVGGEQYYGLADSPSVALGQFATQLTDPETGEVLIEKNPVFREYFELLYDFYSIPGMDDPEKPGDPFVQEQTAAMVLRTNDWLERGWGHPDPEDVAHIDLAPLPVWPDLPTTAPFRDSWVMMIPEYTEYQDEAFKVLETYLDPEIQIGMAKNMSLQTPLVDPEVLDHYGTDLPTYEGKNVDAYFFGEAAIFEGRQSSWDQYVDLGEAEAKIREEKMDVNTVLREVAEESAGKIEEAKAQE